MCLVVNSGGDSGRRLWMVVVIVKGDVVSVVGGAWRW